MVMAYHWVRATLRDGRPVPEDGVWLEHDGPIVMCQSGLHASPTPWEALAYAPGPVLCEVILDGNIIVREHDKLVAQRRKIVRRADLTDTLRAFARAEALSVLHLWKAPDVVRKYLETGREELRAAARAAAWAAGDAEDAWAAAWAAWAAWDAWDAWDAAWAARDAGDAWAARFNALAIQALERGQS